jgi:hypothetical protein
MRFTTNENIVVKEFHVYHPPVISIFIGGMNHPKWVVYGIVLTTLLWFGCFFFNGVYYYQISWIYGGKTNVTTVFQKKTGELGELFLV